MININKCCISFNLKKWPKIPKRTKAFWFCLSVACIYCILQLFFPYNRELEKTHDYSLIIDEVRLRDSSSKGTRMNLRIVSEGKVFYVWYPQKEYLNYSENIFQDLLTGNVVLVSVKVSDKQSVRDIILNQQRIVELRNDDTVYYSLETENN